MSGDGKISVSVVVACRNEIQYVRRFLDSVSAQDVTGISLEILIADGLSEDGTADVLRQYQRQFPNVQLIDNPERIVSTG